MVTSLSENNKYNGVGKVYLFDGRSLSTVYSNPSRQSEIPAILQEIISMNPVKSQLFGFSIGDAKTDLDGNGFYDLVIGDPGKNAQNSHVYYSNSYIRLIHVDTIPKRVLFTNYGVDPVCPEDGYKFCQKIKITMENKGIPIIDPFEPDKLPAIQKWNFASDFTVRVKFSKQFVDTPKMNTVYVSTKLQYVTFGPQQNDSQEADIFVYGNFPEFFGATMVVNADTRISAGYLRLSKPSNGNPVLAPQISQEIEFSIGPLADVKLSVKPKRQQVILDQKKPNMTLAIEVTTLSGQEESFVEGNLEINLGGSNLGLIKASSTPGNIVSCRKDGNVHDKLL